MAYSKQNFIKGMVLTHDHLNHIEDAIFTLSEGGVIQDTTVWYTDFTSTNLANPCNNNSNGWSYSLDSDVALIRGVPINLARFCTDSTSGTVKIGIAPSKNATTISKVVSGTFTKENSNKEIVTVRLSETITLSDSEYLIIEPFIQSSDAFSTKEGAYTFYFGNVDGHNGFLSRIPADLDKAGATPWKENTTSGSIGWSFGYTTAPTGTGDGLGSGESGKVEVDTKMSATSENPVANKVIKSYVDTETSLRGAEYFYYDFVNSVNLDADKLKGGYNASHLDTKGYKLQPYASRLLFKHNIDIDYVKIIGDVELTDTTAVLALGSKTYNATAHASCVKYDFNAKKMIFAAKGTQESIGSAYKTIDISSIVNSTDLRYYIEIGRRRRQVYAAITNYRTGQRIESTIVESGNNLIYPCGWLYDEPTAAQVSGSQAYLRNIRCYVPTEPKVVFLGDSITEGYGTTSDECWATLCCDYFGNSVNMGRSGARIVMHTQKQADELLPTVKPKYVVVTIGTNDAMNATLTQYQTLIKSIQDLNAIPIVNYIYRKTSKTDTDHVNGIVEQLNILGARFDYATSVDNDLSKAQDLSLFLSSDKLHLNVTGNKKVFDRFIADCGFINFLK